MNDFKELLTIKPKENEVKKNKLKIYMVWDACDADYVEHTEFMSPETLFENKKLIYCLAYITCKYNFKGHNFHDHVFCHHILENKDINNLANILNEYNITVRCSLWDDELCHSCKELEITYYDGDGKPWSIDFDDIHKKWENMTYEEICEQINKI